MQLCREEGPKQQRYKGVVQGEARLFVGGTAWRPEACRGWGFCLGTSGQKKVYQEAVNPQPKQDPAAYFCPHHLRQPPKSCKRWGPQTWCHLACRAL